MATVSELTPKEREARKRFIRRYGIQRFGLPTAVIWSIVFYGQRHRSDFHWSDLLSVDFLVLLGLALVLMGWLGGLFWGAGMFAFMRRIPGWTPPED